MLQSFVITSAILLFTSLAFADGAKKQRISPFSESLTTYGVCKRQMKVLEAMNRMKKYFGERGLTIEMHDLKGRFITVNVYKGEKHFDRVILDRNTGRMRSIY